MFNLLPILGGFIVIALGALALRGGRPRLIAPLVFGLLGALMVFVGIVANAIYYIGDAQLAGTVFEEGTWLYIVYGAVLSALGAITYWGPKLWGRVDPRQAGPAARRARLHRHGARLVAVPHRRLRQAAGQRQRVRLLRPAEPVERAGRRRPRARCSSRCWPSSGLAVRSFTKGADAGDDPWDAHTLEWATSSPAPYANFADVHTVASAEPLLDLKPRRDR